MEQPNEAQQTVHAPVLLHEVIEGLGILPDDVVVDATLGGGGHAAAILSRLSKHGLYIGIDLDQEAIARVQAKLSTSAARVVLVENNYRHLATILRDLEVRSINRMLIDLGLSSDQLDQSGRGFSFNRDEPLRMTFSAHSGGTAKDAVNHWSEASLADVIYGFGEETKARRIAKAIVGAREVGPIETSGQLADIITDAVGGRRGKAHPATKTFQALRMAVNDELDSLKEGLAAGRGLLAKGGRIAVISFESITDRVVKTTFKEWEREGDMHVVTRRPIAPDADEVACNPRSRSAKLRIVERL